MWKLLLYSHPLTLVVLTVLCVCNSPQQPVSVQYVFVE